MKRVKSEEMTWFKKQSSAQVTESCPGSMSWVSAAFWRNLKFSLHLSCKDKCDVEDKGLGSLENGESMPQLREGG